MNKQREEEIVNKEITAIIDRFCHNYVSYQGDLDILRGVIEFILMPGDRNKFRKDINRFFRQY